MRLSIIIIGDEILLGQVTDTNSGHIARTFTADGWEVAGIQTVGDDAEAITEAITHALATSDLVITTGGLGPTKDDITKGVLTGIFGGHLIHDNAVSRNIEEVFARRGLVLNELTRQQAMVPSSCRVIQNRYGTAPVMWFERDGRVLIAMPGVPFETEGMLRLSVCREVREHFEPDRYFRHRCIIAGGISESALAQQLAAFEAGLPQGMHLAYLPSQGYIRLRLDACGTDRDALDALFDTVVARDFLPAVAPYIVYDGDATPAEILLTRLRQCGNLTLATAESCTGGNIARCITAVAGCSDVYLGSVVSYANTVKESLLGVEPGTLATDGAVSEATVRQMAEGARKATGADCAIATSGIAGPGGGSTDKPVGTVWLAVSSPKGTVAVCRRFPGDRARVIERATNAALLMLADELASI